MNTKEIGTKTESNVCEYLQSLGYAVLSRNWHCLHGEIDIIATKNQVICFIEVKHMSSLWDQDVISNKVNYRKKLHIRKTASAYLALNYNIKYHEVRFDVAAVTKDGIIYYEGAF